MKAKSLLSSICLLVSTLSLQSQIAIHDAKFLSKFVSGSTFKHDSASIYAISSTLKKYLKDTSVARSREDVLVFFKTPGNADYNPILAPYLNMSPDQGGLSVNSLKNLNIKSIGASLGNMDVTNFSDAMARFLIKRGQDELNVAFFSKLQKFIDDNEEAVILFPKTSKVLKKIEITRYAELIQTIRKAFDEDMKNLPNDAFKLLESEKYAELNVQFPQLGIILRSAHTLSQTDPSKNPVLFVNEFSSYSEWMSLNSNLGNGFQVLGLVSNSLVNTDGQSWISYGELQDLYRNTDAFKIYLGLLYAKSEDEMFTGAGAPVTLKSVLVSGGTGDGRIRNILNNFALLTDQTRSLLAEIRDNEGKLNNDIVYAYLNKTVDIATYSTRIANLVNPNCLSDHYIDYFSQGVELYRYTYTKDYSSAVFSLYSLIRDVTQDPTFSTVEGTVLALATAAESTLKTAEKGFNALNKKANLTEEEKVQKAGFQTAIETQKEIISRNTRIKNLPDFNEKFLTFGNFIAGIAKAESPEEIESIIEASALPAGSSRVKKHANWSSDLNAYVGYYYGQPRTSSDGLFTIKQGITAPVGIAFNRGLHSAGSISVFASVIDIGAVVDYRLSNDSSAIDQTIRLENIVSPGVSLSYGFFGNLPLTLSAGYQYGPNLFKVESSKLTLSDAPRWRWFVSLTVDIPLVHLCSDTKRDRNN